MRTNEDRGHFEKSILRQKRASLEVSEALKVLIYKAYFIASSTATAVATVAPTIGLLPSKEKLIFESFLGSKNPQALILRALR